MKFTLSDPAAGGRVEGLVNEIYKKSAENAILNYIFGSKQIVGEGYVFGD